MSNIQLPADAQDSITRRRFVKGFAAAGALFGMGVRMPVNANTNNMPSMLSGRHFDLTYSPLNINFTGQTRVATAINGSVPAPTLRWQEGETVTLNVTNHMAVDTSIHWHGLILPSAQDGVPNISDGFTGIKPGGRFQYRFPVKQSGTYWYHSHSGFQEQTGAYGAIIIDPVKPPPYHYDREHVVQLSDWSDENPNDIYRKLKKLSHYYNFRERTIADAWTEINHLGWDQFWADRGMWNQMRMSDRDISDVTGYRYTFLTNGQTPEAGWMGLFKKGEKLLLRFINSSAMTFFDVCIPGLKMTVVAADGQYIQPVTVDEFRIGVAETYDVIVEPSVERAYCIFSQAIDRSGYASGTLTPNLAMTIEAPPMDPPPVLTHADMGMDMSAVHHAGMDHAAMGHHTATMDHSKHQMQPRMGSGKAGFGSRGQLVHAESEYGPHVDMRTEVANYQLDDPGIGLRNNGRKVLTYADLKNFNKTPDPREPGRELDLHLTGNMNRYMWSMNGIKFADAQPLELKYGERLRINLVNDTMMNHPIHLHGMWSDLETGDADYIPRKHTVIVQPGAKISYLVSADAKGGWAYHCHLLYHMLGMFRKVEVS